MTEANSILDGINAAVAHRSQQGGTYPTPPCCTPWRCQGIENLWIKQTHTHTHFTHTGVD